MTAKPTPSISHHFSSIKGPRVDRQKKHQMQDISLSASAAWYAERITGLLGLEHGMASHHSNRMRKGHNAANLAVIRHIALNLAMAEKTS